MKYYLWPDDTYVHEDDYNCYDYAWMSDDFVVVSAAELAEALGVPVDEID